MAKERSDHALAVPLRPFSPLDSGWWLACRLFFWLPAGYLSGSSVFSCRIFFFTLTSSSSSSLFLSLLLLEWGYGLFKPALSSLTGESYAEDEKREQERGFRFFYLCSPLGACLGGILAGLFALYSTFSHLLALCTLSSLLICLGSLSLPKRMTRPISLAYSFPFSSATLSLFGPAGALFLFSTVHFGIHLLCHSLLCPYLQDYVDRTLWGWEIPVAWFSSLQLPLQMIVILSLPSLWNHTERRGYRVSSKQKLCLGLLSSSIALFSLAYLTRNPSTIHKQKMAIWIPHYTLLLFSSACINPTLWSSMFQLAPSCYKASSLSLIMVSFGIGGVLPAGILLFTPSLNFSLNFLVMAFLSLFTALWYRKRK